MGGVGVSLLNWYCLRQANRDKDRIPPADLAGRYSIEQLSLMGEHSPFFR